MLRHAVHFCKEYVFLDLKLAHDTVKKRSITKSQQNKVNKLRLGCLSNGSNLCHVLKLLVDNAFTLVVAAELVDTGFDDLHVAFVVKVFFVFVHVDSHRLCLSHEV